MPKAQRVFYEDTIYHIMARGNEKRVIFREARDFERYLGYLDKYSVDVKAVIYCFVIMPNHFHLILRSRNVSKFMQRLQTAYSVYYNKKYKHDGHVFQGPFKDKVIQDDTYLVYLSKYIHVNPVKAGLVSKPADYRWSSFNSIGVQTSEYGFLDNDFILKVFVGLFGGDAAAYRVFVEEGGSNPEGSTLEFSPSFLDGGIMCHEFVS